MLKSFFLLLVFSLNSFWVFSEQALDHSAWDVLLQKYVDDKGNVDYQGFQKEQAALQSYLEYLSENVPAKGDTKEEKLAYYINLYNAATVQLILDHYPIKSIKDIKSPWSKKWIKLDGQKVSLGHIEHKILRKMGDPRIHFAINCASFSCPKLLNRAFEASKLEEQMQEATQDFIQDKSRNIIEAGKLQLSQIFKWYKKDFTEEGSLIAYLNSITTENIQDAQKITYLKYDWSLNESR